MYDLGNTSSKAFFITGMLNFRKRKGFSESKDQGFDMERLKACECFSFITE